MAIAQPPILAGRRLTEEEFLRLPNDGRKYELVNGEVKEVPASFKHDAIGANIIGLMMPFARRRGVLTGSQAGFRMQNRNIRCPDVGYTRKERLPDGQPPEGFAGFAPDICIEIISPSEDRHEMDDKVREYFAAGAQQVWHLFPPTQTLRLFTAPDVFTDLTADDVIDGGDLLPGFQCRVAELFDIGLE